MSQPDPLTLLHSDDPAQRQQAILNLLAARDPQARSQLEQVAAGDPEPDLRALAAQALAALDQVPALPPEAPPPTPSPAPAPEPLSPAEQSLSYAVDAYRRSMRHHAIDHLGHALDQDRALIRDPRVQELAALVTGLPAMQAVTQIINPVTRRTISKDAERAYRPPQTRSALSPTPVWTPYDSALGIGGPTAAQRSGAEVNVWWGITALFIAFVVAHFVFFEMLRSLGVPLPYEWSDMATTTTGENIFLALFTGAIQIGILLLMMAMIHAIAWRMHHGNGTLALLIHRSVPVHVVFLLVSLGNAYLVVVDSTHTLVTCGAVVDITMLIVRGVWLSNVTTQVHHLDGAQGCGSVFISNLVIVIGGFALMFFSGGA